MRLTSYIDPFDPMSRFAMIFPGQGAQSVGMLTAAKQQHAVVDETLAEANEALGLDLAEVINNGPTETLDKTEYTQPALVAASIAYWRIWQQAGGPMPTHLAGHSLGEYSALVVAGAMDFGDALRLTRLRGQAMQGAVEAGQGAMAAIIGLSDDDVVAACQAAGDELADKGFKVSAANFNAPMQVVIAGHADAVTRAGEIAKEKGAKLVKPLAVSVPSHCSLMRPAAERLAAHLEDIPLREPRLPVYHNVDARPREDVRGIRKALVAQLADSVYWADTVRHIKNAGCDIFVECGPSKVLTGLNKRIDKTIDSVALSEAENMAATIARVTG